VQAYAPPVAVQAAFAEHVTPQAPQLAARERSVSQPLVAVVSQSARLAEQVSIAQTAVLQTDVAKGRVHTLPQLPQFAASARRSTHVPPQQVSPSTQTAPLPQAQSPPVQESTRVP
jgi:hypothetical protein